MPEIVEPHVGQPGSPQERLPRFAVEIVAPDGGAPPRAEHEALVVPPVTFGSAFGLLALPVPIKRIHRRGREPYLTAAPPRLGLGEAGTAPREGQGPPHPHGPRIEVDVLPPEAEELALPHAGRDGEDVECRQAVALGRRKEGACLRGGEGAHLRGAHPRRVHGRRDVAWHETPPHGLPQRPVQRGVHVLHALRGEALVELAGDGLAERLAEGAVLPMYGMPSRVRLLYHGLGNTDADTIDRDLDLAVTEFAPGSEKTKDKRVYQSIGFTAPLLLRGGRWVPASGDPLPARRWMSRCERCHFTRTSDENPAYDSCPQCGCGTDEYPAFRVFEFAVPLGFRTNLGRGEDAKGEGEFVAVGVASIAESDQQQCTPVPETNSAVALSGSGRVYRVNNRRGELFRGAPGTTARGRRLEHQWIDERYQTGDDTRFTPTGLSESIALAAPKTTDVLRIQPAGVSQGLALNPLASNGGVKAAYYSAAFILRSVAAERLDIDPEEFDVSNVRQIELDDGRRVGEIVLNDHLANGAGFTRWVHGHWREVLDSTVSTTQPEDTFIGALVSVEHRRECDSSGYDCLRQYRNMSYHGLLDWRLGLSLLRALHSSAFAAGLDGAFDLPDLEDWQDFARQRRNSFCDSFGDCQPADFGPLPGFEVGGMQVIVVHPLWDTRNPSGLLASALAATTPGTVKTLDTFNLLRREGWAYRALHS